jgi:hypothetical protein
MPVPITTIQDFIDLAEKHPRYKDFIPDFEKAESAIQIASDTTHVLPQGTFLTNERKEEIPKYWRKHQGRKEDETIDMTTEYGVAHALQEIRNILAHDFPFLVINDLVIERVVRDFKKICEIPENPKDQKARRAAKKALHEAHDIIKTNLEKIQYREKEFKGQGMGWVLEQGTLNIVDEFNYQGEDREDRKADIEETWKVAKAAECRHVQLSEIFERIRERDGWKPRPENPPEYIRD